MAKKILGLILALAFAVSVVGCKKEPAPDKPKGGDTATTPTKTAP